MDDLENICVGVKSVALEQREDHWVLVVKNAAGMAEVLTQGAQIISFAPRGQEPVLWHSEEIFYKAGTPIRGGVPIIGPWFNALESNPESVAAHVKKKENAPSHGFLRDVQWQLTSVSESSEETRIEFTLEHTRNDLWDRHFIAKMTYEIGASLTMSLEVENTDDADMTYASALHTYFAISDVGHVHVPSFDGTTYIDALDNRIKKQWRGDMIIDQERDYIFLDAPQKQEIIDEKWKRKIILETMGSGSTVFWNPWQAKAKTLSMFRGDEYKKMLCVETATIADDVITIKSGQKHVVNVNITINILK